VKSGAPDNIRYHRDFNERFLQQQRLATAQSPRQDQLKNPNNYDDHQRPQSCVDQNPHDYPDTLQGLEAKLQQMRSNNSSQANVVNQKVLL
jgi:hypothetical protein